MLRRRHYLLALLVALTTAILSVPVFAKDKTYDLRTVKGMQGFRGSEAGQEILEKQGFVVSDPSFKQIFEGYIESPATGKPTEESPMGETLPAFITTDSAWHTYHVLLEEGVKELEEIQSQRLHQFSRLLLKTVRDTGSDSNLLLFASVGLAFQDEQHRQTLTAYEKNIVNNLHKGSATVEMPIGFPLSALRFRPQSFYADTPELRDYFAARQWYAAVAFRLSNQSETKLALALASLINDNLELRKLWLQLSDPFDSFLAPAEDGTVRDYVEATISVTGTNSGVGAATETQLAQIQRKLEGRLALPRICDQLLSPQAYLDFPKQIRGFRLLPARSLPCSATFQNTVDPKIPNRMYPSGLDFMVASPVMRSGAAIRAVQSQFGKNVCDVILKTETGPMPDSLHGEAMHLLAKLQQPLPGQVAAPLRTEAWADLQLWTQLGAWAEQRHTWALHSKPNVNYMGIVNPPCGMVAPYPEFFGGLGKLSRRTAEAFAKSGVGNQQFVIEEVATDLLRSLKLKKELATFRDAKKFERCAGKFEQLGEFLKRCIHTRQLNPGGESRRVDYEKLESDLENLAKRCAASGQADAAGTETLRLFFDCDKSIGTQFNRFALVCDRLADLAKKSLNNQTLTDDDAEWIRDYGVTLAGFHFYYGNSYEVPRDDFPIVTRIYSNPQASSSLYVGLARPQALYIIIPNGDSLQLYRGAVITYRELVHPDERALDDQSWRELLSQGKAPLAPPFTSKFYAETSVKELISRLRAESDAENFHYGDIRDLLWQISARAREKDLPNLIQILAQPGKMSEVADGAADIIARLPWETHQKELIALLASEDRSTADSVAHIFATHPARVDFGKLVSDFDRQRSRTRRLCVALSSRLSPQTDITRNLLLRGLHDLDDGVRWQAALGIGVAANNDPQSNSELLASLNDTNELVGAAVAHALKQLCATNASPILFAKLRAQLQSNTPPEVLERQAAAVVRDARMDSYHEDNILDVDRLNFRLEYRPQRTSGTEPMRLPHQPFGIPEHRYDQAEALIDALGELGYTPAVDDLFKLRDTDYGVAAEHALKKLAPDRLTHELVKTALNKEIDSYVREQALVSLCETASTNGVRELIPLLDDTTVIAYSQRIPGKEWRICDRAAASMGILLEWENWPMLPYLSQERREKMLARAREWAKQSQAQ